MTRRGLGFGICAAVLALAGARALANAPPVVTDITASQRQDGSQQVDIHYNLDDADGDVCTVMVLAGSDGGATWSVPVTAASGAVGPGIAPGVNKLIVWDSAVDLPGVFGDQYTVRVCAYDGHAPSGMVLMPTGEFQMGDTFNQRERGGPPEPIGSPSDRK